MKELEELVKEIKKKRIDTTLKICTTIAGGIFEDTPEEIIKDIISDCLKDEIKKDEHLEDLFVDYCFALGMETLIDELNICNSASNAIDALKI